MNWFRFYHDALNDPKVKRLSGETFKVWVNLLCVASDSGERGRLPAAADCAFALRLDEADMELHLRELLQRGLLDSDTDGLAIHNWNGRQKASDDVTERVRKHRSGPTNNETFQETETKRSGNGLEEDKRRVDTDTEKKREQKTHAQPRDASPSEPFEALVALCEATGADVGSLSPDEKSKQLGKAKQLIAKGKSVQDIGRCAGYCASQHWRTEPVDMFTVEKEWGKWELAGKPTMAQSKPAPNGRASPGRVSNYDQSAANIMGDVNDYGASGPVYETTGRIAG